MRLNWKAGSDILFSSGFCFRNLDVNISLYFDTNITAIKSQYPPHIIYANCVLSSDGAQRNCTSFHFISFHGFVHVCAMSESFLKRSLIGSRAPVYQNDDIWHIICSHRVSEPRLIASNGISINIFSFSSFCCCAKRLTQLECVHCTLLYTFVVQRFKASCIIS